eukprot:2477175-Pleurochrysis_carterae.AAC.2
MAITACGFSPVVPCTASATPQMPNASAAGMESTGRAACPARLRRAECSALVIAASPSASHAASGHASETSHAVCVLLASVVKAYPPTPSTPLASVVIASVPSAPTAAKRVRGASGTPSLASKRCPATTSSSSQSVSARPPCRSGLHSPARRQPPLVPRAAGA